MSANLNKHLSKLSKRGPHRVMVGDLDHVGLPGKIYAPAEGNGISAVAFAHDWRTPVKNYHGTLRHLASWGIAVVAPDTETGFVPDHPNMVADMETALQVAAGVKLGDGSVTVSPKKLGVVGHGMGGGVAILTTQGNAKVRCVAALYPAQTNPSSTDAAKNVTVPGLIIGSAKEDLFTAGRPAAVAQNWGGPVAYRELTKGTQAGFTEARVRKFLLGTGAFQDSEIERARGLLTGFLLYTLEGEKKYEAFASADASAKAVLSPTGEELAARLN